MVCQNYGCSKRLAKNTGISCRFFPKKTSSRYNSKNYIGCIINCKYGSLSIRIFYTPLSTHFQTGTTSISKPEVDFTVRSSSRVATIFSLTILQNFSKYTLRKSRNFFKYTLRKSRNLSKYTFIKNVKETSLLNLPHHLVCQISVTKCIKQQGAIVHSFICF